MRLGMGELLIILLVVVLIFGSTRIPQLGDALGRAIRNFKRANDGDAPPQDRDAAQDPQANRKP